MPRKCVVSRTKKKNRKSKTKRRSSSFKKRRARYSSYEGDSTVIFYPERYDPQRDQIKYENIQVFVIHPFDQNTPKKVEDENLGFSTVEEFQTVNTYSLQLKVVCKGDDLSRHILSSETEFNTLASSFSTNISPDELKWGKLVGKIKNNGYLYLFKSIVVDFSDYSKLKFLYELPQAILDTAIEAVRQGNRVPRLMYKFTHSTSEEIYTANLMMGFKTKRDTRFRSLDFDEQQPQNTTKKVRHRYVGFDEQPQQTTEEVGHRYIGFDEQLQETTEEVEHRCLSNPFRSYGSIDGFVPCTEPVDAEICGVTFRREFINENVVSYTLVPPPPIQAPCGIEQNMSLSSFHVPAPLPCIGRSSSPSSSSPLPYRTIF